MLLEIRVSSYYFSKLIRIHSFIQITEVNTRPRKTVSTASTYCHNMNSSPLLTPEHANNRTTQTRILRRELTNQCFNLQEHIELSPPSSGAHKIQYVVPMWTSFITSGTTPWPCFRDRVMKRYCQLF